MGSNEKNGGSGNKKISVQLLMILVPMIAVFIISVAFIIFANSRNIITEQAINGLKQESQANTNSISSVMEGMKGYYNSLGDTLCTDEYKDDAAVKEALQPGMNEYPGVVNDVYIGFSDKAFIDGGDWVPSADYDPTTRGWYTEGLTTDTIIFGTPDIDMDTKEAVVNGIRAITLKDGRKGVLSTDIFLKSISEEVGEYTPMETGKSILFAGPSIIGSPNPDYVGALATDLTNDKFIQSIYSHVSAGDIGKVYTLKGNDGKNYLVSFENVSGTTWTLASYVKKDDVMKSLNTLSAVTVFIVIFMLVISTAIILFITRKMITKPVKGLTETITKISDGDFSINITKGGSNEIGVMNNRMSEYVERMRSTLLDMRAVSSKLSEDATSSKEAAVSMNQQAEDQSSSMDQIHTAMEGVAQSVTELATNATELATAVSEMTSQGDATRDIMNDLLVKAQKGQKDMDNVQNNMSTISVSMNEMSEVVASVSEAAQKINSIVEMINSISSQTNLLSLNASIEAARAGEAGRGFAVVATEIGNLANDSSNATTEISEIIKDITEQIKMLSDRSESSVRDIANSSEAVSLTGETFAQIFSALDNAGNTVNDMVAKMDKVSDIATNVAAIAEEQSASTEEVTATVETAASSAQVVAEESRGVDHSADSVAESSSRIGEFVESFKL